MKKTIVGLALLFALSNSIHAQTTDSTKANGSNSNNGSNGNNALDTSSAKSGMNTTPADGNWDKKTDTTTAPGKKKKPYGTKPQNTTAPASSTSPQ